MLQEFEYFKKELTKIDEDEKNFQMAEFSIYDTLYDLKEVKEIIVM